MYSRCSMHEFKVLILSYSMERNSLAINTKCILRDVLGCRYILHLLHWLPNDSFQFPKEEETVRPTLVPGFHMLCPLLGWSFLVYIYSFISFHFSKDKCFTKKWLISSNRYVDLMFQQSLQLVCISFN